MGEVKVTTKTEIEAADMPAVEVWPDDDGSIWIRQDDDSVLIAPAAVPALIEALQAAAKEAGDE